MKYSTSMLAAKIRNLFVTPAVEPASEEPICLTLWMDSSTTNSDKVLEAETTDYQWMIELEAQAKFLLVALQKAPDPTVLYFLQLADVALDDSSFAAGPSRKRALSGQLDQLKGLPEKAILHWLSRDTDPFDLPEDAWDAAHLALDHIDCRLSASVQGYPPASARTLL